MEKEYAKFAENYRIEESMKKIEQMFKEEIDERNRIWRTKYRRWW